jgi:hypothetical protein
VTSYYLPPHVHFCCRGDALVFLDLKQDDYVLVRGEAATALRALSSTARGGEMPLQSNESLRELLEAGLLTMDPEAGRIIEPTRTQLALEPLVDFESLAEARHGAVHFWHFTVACIVAAAKLYLKPIERTIASVQRRKRVHASPLNTERACELTCIFQRLRSFFPRNYLCLYDSLALIEFLARYQIFPTWVFGIRLEPWAAHCWVQEGPLIFNEDVEEAAAYSAIMTV